MTRPRALIVYACQGGEARGYERAGFDVDCLDLEPQPRNPYECPRGDAIEALWSIGHRYQLLAGGPPCQLYSKAQRIQDREHPDLIGPTRQAMQHVAAQTGALYVIENVEEARPWLLDPIMLCDASFGLRTYRHRLFESNADLAPAVHLEHRWPTVKMGRPIEEGDFYHAVGNFSGVGLVRRDLDVPWMSRDGIRECIPPAYSEFLGRQLIEQL